MPSGTFVINHMTRRTCAGAIIALTLAGAVFGGNMADTPPRFRDPSVEEASRLNGQRDVIAKAIAQNYGKVVLTKTRADLPILQRLLDDRVFSKTQTYELQSLGIAFGDVLASELSLHWAIVTDQYGTDPTLRYKNTTLQFNSLTMISKRVEAGEPANLSRLLETTREQLAKLAGNTD